MQRGILGGLFQQERNRTGLLGEEEEKGKERGKPEGEKREPHLVAFCLSAELRTCTSIWYALGSC